MVKIKKFLALMLSATIVLGGFSAMLSASATDSDMLNIVIEEDFQDGEIDSRLGFEKVQGSLDCFTEEPYIATEDDGNKYLVSGNGSQANYLGLFTVKDEILGNKYKFNGMSLDFKVTAGSGWYDAKLVGYYDPVTKAVSAIEISHNTKVNNFTVRTYYNSNMGAVDSGGIPSLVKMVNGVQRTGGNNALPFGDSDSSTKWLRLEVSYKTFEDVTGKYLTIAYKVINKEDGTARFTRYENIKVSSFYGFKMGLLSPLASNRQTYLVTDNYTFDFDFEKTDAQKAADFEAKHQEILSKTEEEVGLSDVPAYSSAMADYEQLSDSVKALLTESYAKLQSLRTAMNANMKNAFYTKHQTIIDKTTEDITLADKGLLFAALEEISKMSTVELEAIAEYQTDLTAKENKFYQLNAKYSGDDFESEYYTRHYFENVGTVNQDYNLVDGKFIPVVANFSWNTPSGVTTVKDEYWSKSPISKVTADIKIQPDKGYLDYIYPVYDVREVDGQEVTTYVGLNISATTSTGAWTIRNSVSNVTALTKGAYGSAIEQQGSNLDLTDFDSNKVYRFEASVELLKLKNLNTKNIDNIISVVFEFYDTSDNNKVGKKILQYLWPYDDIIGTKFAIAGKYASYNNCYDNLKVEFALGDNDYEIIASEFNSKYAHIFDNIVDGVVVDTSEEGFSEGISNALKEFELLDSGFKASSYGVEISNKLNLLKDYVFDYDSMVQSGTYTQDFEGDVDFAPYYEYEGYKETELAATGVGTLNGVLSDQQDNTKAFKVKSVLQNGFGSTTAEKRTLFSTANKKLWDTMAANGKYLTSGSFDLYYPGLRNLATEMTVNYGFTDGKNYKFVGLAGGAFKNNSFFELASRYYTVLDGTKALSAGNVSKFTNDDDFANKWWHFDFMYDEQGYFHLVATDETGRICTFDPVDFKGKYDGVEYPISGAVPKEQRILSFGIMGNATSYLIDNVVFRFSENGVEQGSTARADFYKKQFTVETLELSPEKVVPYDFERLNTFIDDFNSLSDTNKALMPMVKAKVDAFTLQMNKWNTSSDEAIADSFYTLYNDPAEIDQPKTLGIYRRLTENQKSIIRKKYAETYQAMMDVFENSSDDSVVDIACVGDSITYGSGSTSASTQSYPQQLANKLGEGYTVSNFGIPGIRVLQDQSINIHSNGYNGQYRSNTNIGYGGAVSMNPDVVIIMLGTNDGLVKDGKIVDIRVENIKKAYTDLVQGFLACDSNPTVIMATIPVKGTVEELFELKRSKLNEIYREIAQEYGIGVIDIGAFTNEWTLEQRSEYFAADNLHPNETGYDKISDFYYEYLTSGKFANKVNGCVGDFTTMKFKTAQPAVSETISLKYKTQINGALLKSAPGIAPYMEFTIQGKEPVVVNGIYLEDDASGNKIYTFEFPNILPQQMAANISAKMVVGNNSAVYDNYSIKKYCINGLNKTAGDLGFTQDKTDKYHSLLANMLKYGTEAQKYLNITDETLYAVYGVDEALLNKGVNAATALENLTDLTALTGEENANYSWKGVTLVLKDKINIRYKFTASDITDLKIKIQIGDGAIKEYTNDKFISTGNENEYYLLIDDVMPYQFDSKISANFVVGGSVTGRTLDYSVNSYLKRMSSNASISSLLNSINNYGSAAKEYVG